MDRLEGYTETPRHKQHLTDHLAICRASKRCISIALFGWHVRTGSRWSADRLTRKSILKPHAFIGHAVEVGRNVKRLSVAAAGIPTLLVSE